MNIKILETGEVKTLSIRTRDGVEWTQDLIGGSGMFGRPDTAGETVANGFFVWDNGEDAYLATQDTYEWWAQYVSDTQETEAEAAALADELNISYADVMERIGEYQDTDYESHRHQAQTAMADLKAQ